jgi:hypothetical protein
VAEKKKADSKKATAKKSDSKKASSSKKSESKKGSDSKIKVGDKVTWKSHGGKAEGRVEDKITKETKVAGRKVTASKDEPQYLVRSAKSGGTAVHKPKALTKVK